MKVRIEAYCPPMPIYKVNGRLRRTAAEPMQVSLLYEDGSLVLIDGVTIPETLVRRHSLGHWAVDPCVAFGAANGVQVRFLLPQEDVLFDYAGLIHGKVQMIAQKMTSKCEVSGFHSNGIVAVVFPDCPTNLLTNPPTAQELTAVGEGEVL